MKPLTIHYSPDSPYCHKLLFFLEEANLPYVPMLVDLQRFDFQSPAFRAISPTGLVPVIEGEFGAVSDSTVAMRYLCDRFRLSSFYPVQLEERAGVDLWLEYVNQHVGRYLMSLAWHRHWNKKRAFETDPVQRSSEEALAKYLPALEEQLLGRKFLTGHAIGLADFNLAAFILQCGPAGFSLHAYPQLIRWWERIVAKGSWQRMLSLCRSGGSAL